MQNKIHIFITAVIAIVVIWLVWRINLVEISLQHPIAVPESEVLEPKPSSVTKNTGSVENESTNEKIETSRFIIITDDGFLTKTFETGADGKLNLSISNQGQNTHSFVIDRLNIKTGPISSGQTVKVTATLPEGTTSLDYYSDSGNDASTDIFKGTIKILEK
ncbi:MAG: hypothetical protein WCX69_00335 [Candidatus Paceibacterota bacterium]